MGAALSKSNQEMLLEQLDDMGPDELFDLLNDDTQIELKIEFVNDLDDHDRVDCMFSKKARDDSWSAFLSRRCLRDNYHSEIEENHVNANDVDPA